MKDPPKTVDEWYAYKVISTALDLIQNKIDRSDGEDEKLIDE